MSSLLELPAELLLEILSLCSSIDMKRVCETCHQLYDVGVCKMFSYPSLWLNSIDAGVISRH